MVPAHEWEWESLPEYEFEGSFEGETAEYEAASEWEGEFSPALQGEYEGLWERVRQMSLVYPSEPVSTPYPAPYASSRELEGEGEYETNPQRRIYPDVVMGHIAHAAMRAQARFDADAMAGALVPMALQSAIRTMPGLPSRGIPPVLRVTPHLVRGAAGIVRIFRNRPNSRPLVQTIPALINATTRNLLRQAVQGIRITPRRAVRALDQQCQKLYTRPVQVRRIIQRAQRAERTYQANPVMQRSHRSQRG